MGCGYECAYWQSSCQAGWRTGLWRKLSPSGPTSDHWDFVGTNQNGPDDIDKDHEGYPGWTCEHVQEISDSWASLKPDIILLHLGTNNMGGYQQTAALAVHAMGTLLNVMFTKLPDVHLFLSTLIGTHDLYGGAKHAAYNAGLKMLAKKYRTSGYNVDLVDMDAESGIGKRCDSENCCDGHLMEDIHPNKRGYDRMADVWHRHLTSQYNTTQGGGKQSSRSLRPHSSSPAHDEHANHSQSVRHANESAADRFASAVRHHMAQEHDELHAEQRENSDRPKFLH